MGGLNLLFSKRGFLGITILTIGLMAGILLVARSQEFRERAKKSEEIKITVCHKTGSDDNPWAQIEVSEEALKGHIDHGDILNTCPSDSPGPPPSNESGNGDDTESSGNSSSEGIDRSSNTTNTTNITNITVNLNSAQTPTPTHIPYTGPTRLDFYIRFQGIDSQTNDKKSHVILRQDSDQKHFFNDVTLSPDVSGVFGGSVVNIVPGTYDVLIKGDYYLQKEFAGVVISRGINSWYWTKNQMVAGDFDQRSTVQLVKNTNLTKNLQS